MIRSLAAIGALFALMPITAEAQSDVRSRVSLTLSGGFFLPSAGGDLLPFFEDELTLSGGDLRGTAIEAEVGIPLLSSRFELFGGFDTGRGSQVSSQFRGLADGGAPIEQTTRLSVGPTLFLGGKLYLNDPSASESKANAFLVAGGGTVLRYELRQWGSFYDAEESLVFDADFVSEGRASTWFAGAGGEIRLNRASSLTGRVRYQWGSATPQQDFREFDAIDLSGMRMSLGITYRR
jgi:hypothetical protein